MKIVHWAGKRGIINGRIWKWTLIFSGKEKERIMEMGIMQFLLTAVKQDEHLSEFQRSLTSQNASQDHFTGYDCSVMYQDQLAIFVRDVPYLLSRIEKWLRKEGFQVEKITMPTKSFHLLLALQAVLPTEGVEVFYLSKWSK